MDIDSGDRTNPPLGCYYLVPTISLTRGLMYDEL